MANTSLWSELVPYRELRRSSLLGDLARRDLGLIVAVTPEQLDDLPAVIDAGQRAGLRMGVWPMIGRREGRWVSAHNAAAFTKFGEQVLARLDAEQLRPEAFAIDLEPPIGDVEDLLARRPRAFAHLLRGGRDGEVLGPLRALVDGILGRGMDAVGAALPMVVSDGAGVGGWQRLLGTPVDALPLSRVSSMVYSSMIEGYAGGRLNRADCLALVGAAGRAARRRYGRRASLSLGAVGHGILGDEPTYRSPRELAEDVGAARAAGIDHLIVFSLGGVIARPPMDAWLDALAAEAAPRSAAPTPRARAVMVACAVASRAVAWGHRAATAAGLRLAPTPGDPHSGDSTSWRGAGTVKR